MRPLYFEEPYEFIAPYRSQRWCRVLQHFIPGQLRRKHGIRKWEFRGVEKLRESIDKKHGIILVPNHTNASDPPILGMLSIVIGNYFYFAASWHLFKQSKHERWLLTRLGAFSMFREGSNREGIRECARILAEAERPLVIFPEGTYFWQNDRLGPMREGLSLIARHAAKKADRPIVLHPVAMKYWCLRDPLKAIAERLSTLERWLRWSPQDHLPLAERICKLDHAYLAIKEIEYFGAARTGDPGQRMAAVAEHLLAELERQYFGGSRSGQLVSRVHAVRHRVVGKLPEVVGNPTERAETWRHIGILWFCQQVFAHSLEYLLERPSIERLAESVHRLEEDLTDNIHLVSPLGAVVEVGDPVNVSDYMEQKKSGRTEDDPLLTELATRIQQMLDGLLAAGPPPAWRCPKPLDLPQTPPKNPAPIPASA